MLFAAFALGGLVAAAPRDSAVIVDSGSTNTQGYKIEVWSDGTASLAMPGPSGSAQSAPKSFTIPAETTTRFFSDLAAARKVRTATEVCMKSASFGTTTHVTWQGWTSPDLDCPPNDPAIAALVKDVSAIRQAAGINGPPLRRAPLTMPSTRPKPS